jgi:hypothetical protein
MTTHSWATAFQTLAAQAVANAKNPDWRERGTLTVATVRTVKRIATDGKTYRDVERGPVHVAAVRFEIPHGTFTGFYLAVDDATGATVSKPIIGPFDERTLDERPYQWAANELNCRFCPSCNSLDSVKTTQKVLGECCVKVTHRCRVCGFTETDIAD